MLHMNKNIKCRNQVYMYNVKSTPSRLMHLFIHVYLIPCFHGNMIVKTWDSNQVHTKRHNDFKTIQLLLIHLNWCEDTFLWMRKGNRIGLTTLAKRKLTIMKSYNTWRNKWNCEETNETVRKHSCEWGKETERLNSTLAKMLVCKNEIFVREVGPTNTYDMLSSEHLKK